MSTKIDCKRCADFERFAVCNGGDLYGRCEDPQCGGWCSYAGPCDCDCHLPAARLAEEENPSA